MTDEQVDNFVKTPTTVYDEAVSFPAWKVELTQKITAQMALIKKLDDEVSTTNEMLKGKKAQLAKAELVLKKICNKLEEDPAPLFKDAPVADQPEQFNATSAPGNVSLYSAYCQLCPTTLGDLAKAGLKTIWDVAQFSRQGKEFTEIPGVGPHTMDEILKADEEFWSRWNTEGHKMLD